MNNAPYPQNAARQYPPGVNAEMRRIEKCSDPKAWYAGRIGEIIIVHYFVTFGAWDTNGRFLWYYDLSAPLDSGSIKVENKTIPAKRQSWLKKIFK